MLLAEITPVVLALNEELNIARCLAGLSPFPCVVVVDSGSSDRTAKMAASFPNVRVETRAFDTHATQWNFGVAQAKTEWVLSLDSDYMVSEDLLAEIVSLEPPDALVAYYAEFRYVIRGEPLRRSVLPPRAVLFRPSSSLYIDDGHTQLLEVDGATGWLDTPIDHDDRKSLDRWLNSQAAYADLEARKLRSGAPLGIVDRIRSWKWLAPIAIFVYVLVTGGLRSGWRGLYYAQQRMVAEAIQSLRLIELELEDDQVE